MNSENIWEGRGDGEDRDDLDHYREDRYFDVKRWLQRQDTAPALTAIIIRVLHKFTQGQVETLDQWNFANEPNTDLLDSVMEDQK